MPRPPEQQDARLMREMFHAISPRYDFITRVFSYGMDGGWKRRAVREAALPRGAFVLDLACGTGDFSRLIRESDPMVRTVAADLTFSMLLLAREGGAERTVAADGLRLPFPDGCFDAVFVGYGLRNFPDLDAALDEMRRVLTRGGRLVSLDFFLPANAVFRRLYLGYLWAQGALWGLLLHGRPRIYTYIPDSLRSFVTIEEYNERLARHGFVLGGLRRYILGGIGAHCALRMAAPGPPAD